MHLDSSPSGLAFSRPTQFCSPHKDEEVIESDSGSPTAVNDVNVRLGAVMTEKRELLAEMSRLRADRDRMAEILSGLTSVLGSKSPDRLVHDVRNVLNERDLYRVLAEPHM